MGGLMGPFQSVSRRRGRRSRERRGPVFGVFEHTLQVKDIISLGVVMQKPVLNEVKDQV